MAAGREEETPRRCDGLGWPCRCDMALRLDTCRIVHISEKPPVSPHQQPTVNVYASPIEPKLTNTIIRRLNQVLPLENLRHVKRVQKKSLEGGLTPSIKSKTRADNNIDDLEVKLGELEAELVGMNADREKLQCSYSKPVEHKLVLHAIVMDYCSSSEASVLHIT